MTRQAAHDLLFSYESDALDALEYLRSTGQWVVVDVFGVPSDEYERGVVDLVTDREKRTGVRLPVESLRKI